MLWRGGENVMAVSRDLAEMARDATIGMTDAEVMAATGLSLSSWRRLLSGQVISDKLLLQFTDGMKLDPEPFLAISRRVRPSAKPADIVAYGLGLSPLSQSARMKVMQLYRKFEREAEEDHEKQNAA